MKKKKKIVRPWQLWVWLLELCLIWLMMKMRIQPLPWEQQFWQEQVCWLHLRCLFQLISM